MTKFHYYAIMGCYRVKKEQEENYWLELNKFMSLIKIMSPIKKKNIAVAGLTIFCALGLTVYPYQEVKAAALPTRQSRAMAVRSALKQTAVKTTIKLPKKIIKAKAKKSPGKLAKRAVKKTAAPKKVAGFKMTAPSEKSRAPEAPALTIQDIPPYFESGQPIVLTGDQVLEIKDLRYVLRNTITLRDRAKLIIKNAAFEQRPGDTSAGLEARDASEVIIENSRLHFDPNVVWHVRDSAILKLKNIANTEDALAYHELHDQARVEVVNAIFMGYVRDLVSLEVHNSPDVRLDLDLSGGAIIDEQFPARAAEYVFPQSGDMNLHFRINLTNSAITHWGVTVHPTSDITIRDTENIRIIFLVRSPWKEFITTVSGLKPGKYNNYTLRLSQSTMRVWDLAMRIRLINTTVSGWQPIVGDDNTLIIKDSDILEQNWSWGNAKLVLENSRTTDLRAADNVEISALNSTVTGDVRAQKNGKIKLVGTKVDGTVSTADNGTVAQ